MENRYPQLCGVCQGIVPAGKGTLRKEGSGWSVIHAGVCPREDHGSIRHGHAQAYARRVLRLLSRDDAPLSEVMEATNCLGALVRTGWMPLATCERVLLGSRALSRFDRFSVESILGQLTSLKESHA